MIPMHPHLISQLITDRQAHLMAAARQRRLARQARAARRARPAQRGHAAPMLAALRRLAWRRSSPRTLQTPAAGPGQGARLRTANGHAISAGHRACRPPSGEPSRWPAVLMSGCTDDEPVPALVRVRAAGRCFLVPEPGPLREAERSIRLGTRRSAGRG